jgi:alpha-ketoglutarate-dependent taurine dioxygenase
MDYTLHENGWTVIVEDDIRDLSSSDILNVAKLLSEQTVVVFNKQIDISPENQLEIAHIIGDVMKQRNKSRSNPINLIDGIIRVTGKKNDKGEPGLFGHTSALDWHANQASNKNRDPIVWMYGAEGMEGSRTSFINMANVYENLPDDFKKEIKNIKCFFGYEAGKYSTTPYFRDHVNTESLFDLVMTVASGKTSLYYPFLQVFGMDQIDEDKFKSIHNRLVEYILDEQHSYHHNWLDGQILLSDQWLSLHKRWEFDKMEERVLHRIAINYKNVYESYP